MTDHSATAAVRSTAHQKPASGAGADAGRRSLRVLFLLQAPAFLRNFESTVAALAARGHEVHIAFDGGEAGNVGGPRPVLERLADEWPLVDGGEAVRPPPTPWRAVAAALRNALDHLHYLDPRFADAPKLRLRAASRVPRFARLSERVELARSPARRAALARLVNALERAVPPAPEVQAFLEEQRPDVLLVTPLVEWASPQVDFVRAAHELGIPSVLCVHSWDNLTSKGLVRETPDLVTVWNSAQRREAVELHGIEPERVVVTGAQAWDQWFEWTPSTSREAFCARVGLDPDRPFVLYLGSSPFIAPQEAGFTAEWIERMRASSDPLLSEAGVLVRPHPKGKTAQWEELRQSGRDQVAVYPPAGADPVGPQSRADFFDSMYHSSAVVGVNTSAFIESAIVGRPVFTMLAPEFRQTQDGTLHFQLLRKEGGGMLNEADSFDEHFSQLAAALHESDGSGAASAEFLEAFVRPFGLDEPATPRLVEAVEAVAERRPAPPVRSPATPLARLALLPAWPVAAWRLERKARSKWIKTRRRRLRRDALALGQRLARERRRRMRRARRAISVGVGAVVRRLPGRR